ncbi:GNAT family N-acetyltransferase [Erythrobacter aureus]|uniref:N-acetyltransferase n=1 Tax=Erythrobacter aureus TaxID=2182384 RepID=A0A345YDR7_9SPHN|nr:GNAT family protein [Erythrobacter aureus]AXK42069.1 N-acetyltransferase [Erythrobacter aureus]
MIKPVTTLQTPRFTMRKLRRQDAAALLPTLGDEAQCRYLSRPAFSSEEELWNWLADPSWTGRTWIAEDACGTVVGRFVAVPDEEEEGVEEIGYITCAERQGMGIARECTAALVAHLFDGGHVRRLIAEIDAENSPSIRLIERLGFRRDALHMAYEETHKGVCDVAIYSLSREGQAALRESE